MNNNPCIIFAVEGHRLLVYIRRVSDHACSPLNQYPSEPRHLSEFACDSNVGLATRPGAPKVLSDAPTCSQTYHNQSHGTPVPVIRDPSYSRGRPECPPNVWYSPQIDASKFTLHILSDTPGGSHWLKYILLMAGKERGKVRQHATSDRFGRACWQIGEKEPPRVAKYKCHGCDSLGVECQGKGSIPQISSCFVYICEARGGGDWYHQQQRRLKRAIHSIIDVWVYLGAGWIWWRV